MKSNFAAQGLKLRRDLGGNGDLVAAHRGLISEVLGCDSVSASSVWSPIGFFAPGGQCVAALDVGFLPLVLDGVIVSAAAIGAVATHPAWRGRGLFTALMRDTLDWCDMKSPAATLLYTETPALYEPFGFRSLPQHAFAGPAPAPLPGRTARRLELVDPKDRALVRDLVADRVPVSRRCALLPDAALFIANIAKDDSLMLVYAEDERMLVVYEQNEGVLVIVDVLAASLPTLAAIAAALDVKASHMKCLFSPDRFSWHGAAVREETGLMMRGTIPPTMREPFMFSPTSEF